MIPESLFRMRWLVGTAALLTLTACGDDTEPPPEQPLTCDAQTYDAAVREAVEPTSADVYNGLFAISASNPKLVWNAEKTAVRMVIWTSFTGYTVGDNTLTREVWMTAAPQVQELCKTVPAEELVARLNEYLGLPPATEQDNARYFVEAWVKPGDMFRPCPDAEIDDTSCSLEFPANATAEHKAWMNGNYSYSYGFWQKTKYPWTGLGYTYDWCNADTRVGASEYVVRTGSTINVTGKIDRATYCAP
ncbi:hypothetical protein [Hyalangium sp.]|uniref:hypothetical protein n=1 Tax=Hyalangium sp. TaxID=2028555 RepID=UPI002D449670|nr:hypothetical protein [Hyalangium sp.]HYH99294.1 hypothetical protein [Hyalangium sp.]